MVTLKNELEPFATVANELKDGQLAIITDTKFAEYNGTIVQRYGNSMVAIGLKEGSGWSDITYNTLKVRVLDEGEILVVTNNK